MTFKPLITSGFLALGLLIAGTASGAATPSASQAIPSAQSAVTTAGSMTFVATESTGTLSEKIVGAIGPTSAQETFALKGKTVTQVRLVNNTIYLWSSTAQSLQGGLGISATTASKYIKKWVSIVPSHASYNALAQSLTLAQVVQFPTASTAKVSGTKTVNGIQYLSVTGAVASGVNETINISQTTNLPVSLSLGFATGKTTSLSSKRAFARWGSPVTVAVPAGAVALP